MNIGADGRYGCPQLYNIHYVELLNMKMDGGYVTDIVDNARKSNWVWNPRIGMYILARPETICLDQNGTAGLMPACVEAFPDDVEKCLFPQYFCLLPQCLCLFPQYFCLLPHVTQSQ